MTSQKYFIYGIHKRFGWFNEFTKNIKLAKRIACSLIKSNYFTWIEISTNYYGEYYHANMRIL